MDITVRTNELKEKNGATLAVANIEFGDQLKIRNVTVKEGPTGRFVSMPSYMTNKVDEHGNNIFKEVFNPITANARETLYGAVLESLDSGKEVVINDDAMRNGNDITARVVPLENSVSGAVGIGRLYINECFVVNNVTVRENKDGEKFVSYPSYKSNEVDENGKAVYKDFVYPSSKESRESISKVVMDAFTEAKEIAKSASDKENPEALMDEKPKGIKAKLKDGEEKSKKGANKVASTPKKAKEAEIG